MSNYTAAFFFFNDSATTEIYTLSLHDALPILRRRPDDQAVVGRDRRINAHPARAPSARGVGRVAPRWQYARERQPRSRDRKSTRLNSSHANISYAVFCLKKKIENI